MYGNIGEFILNTPTPPALTYIEFIILLYAIPKLLPPVNILFVKNVLLLQSNIKIFCEVVEPTYIRLFNG